MNLLTNKAQRQLDLAAQRGGRVVLPLGEYDEPLVLQKAGDFVCGVEVVAYGGFSGLIKAHDGPFLITKEAKDCSFSLPVLGSSGIGVLVEAQSSSSRLVFDRCHFQGLDDGIVFSAEGGADISVTHVKDSQFTLCDRGVVYEGSNNLDPRLSNVNFSECQVGVDAREGGSNLTAWACGGSYCGTVFWSKAGYQARVDVTSFEGSGVETFLRIGGPDAGGSGSHTSVVVTANDVRTVKTLADIQCSGDVTLDVRKASGQIVLTNKSGKPGTVKLSPAAYALKRIEAEGDWTVVPN